MSRDAEDGSSSDEIKREDGLERHWLFYNGQWAETICGLAAAIAGVFWCFLYILGYSETILGYSLAAIVVIGLVSFRFFYLRVQELERRGWQRQRSGSPGAERKKLFLALGLWAFIILSFGFALLRRRGLH